MRTATREIIRRAALSMAALLLVAGAAGAATITIVNNDGANEGFNDPTAAAPVGGNPGVTIGAQRLYVFQYAANIWGNLLCSNVEIRVNAQFNPQSCNATSGVLGSAGPVQVFANFPGAPFGNHWYHVALANKLTNADLSASNDINATFNSSLGTPTCLPQGWYYGVDGNEGTAIELLPVVIHELGHGLGFSTTTNGQTGNQLGTPPNQFPSIYDKYMLDLTQNLHWDTMTPAQRVSSGVNCEKVVWDGPNATAQSGSFLGPRPAVRVLTPAPIAGDYPVGLAQFGAALSNPGVTGSVVLANDGDAYPTNGCEAFTNAAAIAGNIALVDRGTCTFIVKVKNAQNAGAIGVIVADSVAGCPPAAMGGADPTITIPAVRITQSDGALIKANLGGGVTASLLVDPAVKAGADNAGHVLLYTPIPYASGSSVSHWSTSAEPSLLMEPAITNGLSSSVDLTEFHFMDIGWTTCPTATTLVLFTAESRDDGILLRWQFSDPSDVGAITIERATSVEGSWEPVSTELGSDGNIATALDRSGTAGTLYFYRLSVMDRAGNVEALGMVSARRGSAVSAGLMLGAPTPNPTSKGCSVMFRLERAGYVRLAVVDAGGRRVRTLHEGMMTPGEYTRSWDGLTDRARSAMPGLYFVTLRTAEGMKAQRVAVN